jgi:hypothetical protein
LGLRVDFEIDHLNDLPFFNDLTGICYAPFVL